MKKWKVQEKLDNEEDENKEKSFGNNLK